MTIKKTNQIHMNKNLPFLVFLLILSACSNWKYGGKVRPSGNEVRYAEVVIEKDKVDPLVITVPNLAMKDLALTEENIGQKKLFEINKDVEKKEITDFDWIPIQDKVVENDDSIKKQQEILKQALKAEREGLKSNIFGVIGAVLSITPMFVGGLVFSIIALKQSRRALNAEYITPNGLRRAKIGMVFSIIGIVLASLVILTILGALIFYIFIF